MITIATLEGRFAPPDDSRYIDITGQNAASPGAFLVPPSPLLDEIKNPVDRRGSPSLTVAEAAGEKYRGHLRTLYGQDPQPFVSLLNHMDSLPITFILVGDGHNIGYEHVALQVIFILAAHHGFDARDIGRALPTRLTFRHIEPFGAR